MSDSSVSETAHVFIITAILGATVFVVIHVAKLLRAASNAATAASKATATNVRQKNKNEPVAKAITKEKGQGTNVNNNNKQQHKKKAPKVRWSGKGDKQSVQYPWLLMSLKGHNGPILDMDFSSDGKYLATCSEDVLDPGGDAATSSGSECNNKELDRRSPAKMPVSRRRRKNRRRRDDCDSSPDVSDRRASRPKRGSAAVLCSPLRQHTKLNVADVDLYGYLRSYVPMPEQLLTLGYPVESELYPGRAIIYKNPGEFRPPRGACAFDVNAREFVPRLADAETRLVIVNAKDDLEPAGDDDSRLSGDSGRESGSSSPASVESESSESVEHESVVGRAHEERKCVRCGRPFMLGTSGEYVTRETCAYHWGKPDRVYRSDRGVYTCCGGDRSSRGCSTGKLHVWSGVSNGINGPLDGFVVTQPRDPFPEGGCGVYALDCEMCYTVGGLELTKVTVVASDGRLVYDCFVKPDNEIIDYNTRFSGITARDLDRKSAAKSLRDVQTDLLAFVAADTILIGHGLENDLRALRIVHRTVVDTAVTFPHYYGLPFRRSLKSLTSHYLKREIQSGGAGHNSFEDARACMELMLWRVRKDFRNVIEKCQ